MFWSIRTLVVGWFIAGSAFLILNSTVWSEASNPVTVQISDVCRYHIENIGSVPQIDSNLAIETVNISILSNSERTWQLLVSCKDTCPIEWSMDGTIWRNLGAQPIIVLTGSRSFWKQYSLLYRYHNQSRKKNIGFQYQIVFQDW